MGSIGHQLRSFWSLRWLTSQRSSLADVEEFMSPPLVTSSSLSSFYKYLAYTVWYSSYPVHSLCFSDSVKTSGHSIKKPRYLRLWCCSWLVQCYFLSSPLSISFIATPFTYHVDSSPYLGGRLLGWWSVWHWKTRKLFIGLPISTIIIADTGKVLLPLGTSDLS